MRSAFLKLTADQVLVFDWIAGSGQVVHLNVNKAFFCAVSAARRGYTAILREQELLAVDVFCVQVENGLENIFFPAFIAGFNSGLT